MREEENEGENKKSAGLRAQGSELRAQSSGLRAQGAEHRAQSTGRSHFIGAFIHRASAICIIIISMDYNFMHFQNVVVSQNDEINSRIVFRNIKFMDITIRNSGFQNTAINII